MKSLSLIIALTGLLLALPLEARTEIGVITGGNEGIHLEEAGSRYPNISPGFAAGSRISYPRDFPYGGLYASEQISDFTLRFTIKTTGGPVTTGMTRDEDFLLYPTSRQRDPIFDPGVGAYYDSPYVFSGHYDFSDARARTMMIDLNTDLNLRYAPEWLAGFDNRLQFFLSGSYRYSHTRYHIYDLTQVTTDTHTLIGYYVSGFVLGYVFSLSESSAGGGISFDFGPVVLSGELRLLTGTAYARDTHIYRNLNFTFNTMGYGFLYRSELRFQLTPQVDFGAAVEGHRFYGAGYSRASGGRERSDILIASAGRTPIYTGTKESSAELFVALSMDLWDSESVDPQSAPALPKRAPLSVSPDNTR